MNVGTLLKRFATPGGHPVTQLTATSSTSVAFTSGNTIRFVHPGSWRLESKRVCEGSTSPILRFVVDPANKLNIFAWTADGRMLTFTQRRRGNKGFTGCDLDASVVVHSAKAMSSGARLSTLSIMGYSFVGAGIYLFDL